MGLGEILNHILQEVDKKRDALLYKRPGSQEHTRLLADIRALDAESAYYRNRFSNPVQPVFNAGQPAANAGRSIGNPVQPVVNAGQPTANAGRPSGNARLPYDPTRDL